MPPTAEEGSRDSLVALLVTCGSRTCALPVASVLETMRALPIEAIPGAPAGVLGLSIVRGRPVPVIALDRLLGTEEEIPGRRFVLLRLSDRQAVLAVEDVVGVRSLDRRLLEELAPLLRESDRPHLIAAIGAMDQHLLAVLDAARILPEEAWQQLAASEVRS